MQESSNSEKKIIKFLPAVVRKAKSVGTYVEYYYYDPMYDTMIRKRVRVTRLTKRCKTKREAAFAAQQVAEEINRRLAGGWSPLQESENARLYTSLPELRSKFLASKKAEGCRDTTMVNYTSMTRLFLEWIENTGRTKKHSGEFMRHDAVAYMDFIMEKGNSNRSFNNTLKCIRCFWEWAKEHCYCNDNPFQHIKYLPKNRKKRILIDSVTRKIIADYFCIKKPPMLIVCQLVYSSAMRPLEIRKIQIKHIDIARRCIVVPDSNAKNGKSRCATLTRQTIELLIPILAANLPADDYLFGKGIDMAPGPEPSTRNYFRKCWDRMRDRCGLPDEMQLYSLRDSGLTDLLHAGVDQLTVQHHADHSSIAIQNIYTDHFDPGVNEKIFEKAPSF